MDIIFLRELKVETLIGVYEWEKQVPQTLQIDLDIALPDSRACETDDIADALNYADIVRRIQAELPATSTCSKPSPNTSPDSCSTTSRPPGRRSASPSCRQYGEAGWWGSASNADS